MNGRQKFHDAFMKKYHDWLVSKSKAKVKVLGYYTPNKVPSTDNQLSNEELIGLIIAI